MKKTIVIILIAFLAFPTIQAQKTVIGTVDYSYKMLGEGAESLAGMMPNKMIIKYGENGLVMEMDGGMMATAMGKTVVNGLTGEAFMVKDAEKTIYLMSDEDIEEAAAKNGEPVIEKLNESKKILGYKCNKYKYINVVEGASITQMLWVTDELVAPEYKAEAFKGMAGKGAMNFDVDGFPMLIEIEIPGAPMTLELEVTNIKFGKLNKSEFEKPSGYTTKSFSEMSPF
ncbi:MAG: DUF4412 domain-containing protein [Bacteroidales bacterium]|jgi:hypothetical protein|nr:DUF4412 domain-containing protein [Bacteroidales bacterium]